MAERGRATVATFESYRADMAERLGRRGVSDLENATVVVLPSISFPPSELRKIIGIQYYEERMLCMLLLLKRPRMEIVYVTSVPIDPSVIDYYLSFVPDPGSARARLHLISVGDARPIALSEKLLERPDVVEQMGAALRDPKSSYLFPFNVTHAEQTVSESIGIPLYGPHPDQIALGSKSGSRRVARVAGVPVLAGSEDLYSATEIESAIESVVARHPDAKAVVVKLNNGFSGQGNLVIDLDRRYTPLESSHAVFCAAEETWPSFLAKIESEGGVVEELVREPGAESPSVQMRIFADGAYEVVSTHDQILGGPDDQVYLGCLFPARWEYRTKIQAYGLGIARELASHGVVGAFGVDFVVTTAGAIFLTEINLRLGGTTHPFLMARFATDGMFDMNTGELIADQRAKAYIATDNLKSPTYVGLSPAEAIDAVADAGIAFDRSPGTGVTLHLLGAVTEYGKLGATSIGDTLPEARELHDRLLEVLDSISRDAGDDGDDGDERPTG